MHDLPGFTLPAAAVDVFCEALRLPRPGYPLDIPSAGSTMRERGRIAAERWAAAENDGLARHGRLEPEVELALQAICRPKLMLTLLATDDETPLLRALTVERGEAPVLAVQRGDTVRFELLRDSDRAAAMIDLLPSAPAGHGRAFEVPQPEPKPDGYRGGTLRQVQAASETERRAKLEVLTLPRQRAGAFAVVLRDGPGRSATSPQLSWFDTERGRYAVLFRKVRGGADRMTCAPAGRATLLRELRHQSRLLAER